jgi:hypothetical protein
VSEKERAVDRPLKVLHAMIRIIIREMPLGRASDAR